MNTRPYRPDIDGLRAVAVLAVVAYHALPKVFHGGFAGVDIFFVISGFLISGIIIDAVDAGRFSLADFYARRIRRIFPALLLVLAATAVGGWLYFLPDQFLDLGTQTAAAGVFSSNFVLWRDTGYFSAAAESKPLLHLWSLAIEEQFYLVWPLLLAAVVRSRRGLAGVGLVTAGSFLVNVALTRASPIAAFYNPVGRFWELTLGGGLALLQARGALAPLSHRASDGIAAVGAGLLACGMGLLNTGRPFPGWWALLPTVGSLLILWAGSKSWLGRNVLASRPLVFIGVISYPLYLWHWPVLTFARSLSLEPLGGAPLAGLVGGSVVLAWATWSVVERRVRHRRGPAVIATLTGAMALMTLAGIVTWTSGGLRNRFPPAVQAADRYAMKSDSVSIAWRRHECMLESEVLYSRDCIDSLPSSAPLVFLWGDSHAAALVPGIRMVQREATFRLGQFSTSRCPPIIRYKSAVERLDNPNCAAANDSVVAMIRIQKPAVVVLNAYWSIYDPAGLSSTLATIRAAGVQSIIVVGNVPRWRMMPARLMFHYYLRDRSGPLPTLVPIGYVGIPRESEQRIEALALASRVEYVPLIERLCDERNCRLMQDNGELTYSDRDHLSPPGARWIVPAVLGDRIRNGLRTSAPVAPPAEPRSRP